MTHEFDGNKYEKASTHQKEWGAKLLSEIALSGTESVLDLGCGDGTNTVRIAELVPNGEVVGIDASKGMIDVAKQKERDNLHFVLMDINELNFTDKFDVVFSNATLHWVQDHNRLFVNVIKCLRRGGFLRFNFAADGNCSHFFKVIRKAMLQERFSRYFINFEWPWYMPAVDEYKVLVEKSTLRDARVWGENADRFFPDVEMMIRWVDQPSLVPFLACVAKKDRAPFREFVVGKMIEETKYDDGRCFETFRRINLLAKK